jgi:hypothetical protein
MVVELYDDLPNLFQIHHYPVITSSMLFVSGTDIVVKLPCKDNNGWKTVRLALLTLQHISANYNSHPQGERW